MAREIAGLDFSLPIKKEFPMRYEGNYDDRNGQMEARSVATYFGQIIEPIAANAIIKPFDLEVTQREFITESLHTLVAPLTNGVRSAAAADKKLPRSSVLPIYTETFQNNLREVVGLSREMDKIHGTEIFLKLKEVAQGWKKDGGYVAQTKVNYLLDGLIMMSKITLNGIGTDLSVFGNLLPDVPLREQQNGNSEVTQLDGIFLPKGMVVPEIGNTLYRESIIRDLGSKEIDYPEGTPPIAHVPAILEIKSHFRTRWTIGNLPNHIPPYQMRELMQRFGMAYTLADIVVLPQAIVYLRIRSLAPNSITIFHPGLEFYSKWQEAIKQRADELQSQNIQDYYHSNNLEKLRLFQLFLECHNMVLQRASIRRNGAHPDETKVGRQKKLRNF